MLIPANRVESTLAVAFVQGTSTEITLASVANCPAKSVVYMDDDVEWCLVKYALVDAPKLKTLTNPLAVYESSGANGYEFPIGTKVCVAAAADLVEQLLPKVTAKTGACTLTLAEQGLILVSADAAYTITLPTAVGNKGLTYRFLKTDANYNLITLDGDGGETFNYPNDAGAAQTTYPRLNTYCAEVTVVSDGANWQCINEKLGLVPKCRVYLGTMQEDLVDDTVTLLNLDTENYDVGSNFNTTTHKFVTPIPGKYKIIGQIYVESVSAITDSKYICYIYNGAASMASSGVHSSSVKSLTALIVGEFPLAIDDEITLCALAQCGAATTNIDDGTDRTWVFIKLVEKD